MSDVFWFGWTVHPWHVKLIISWSARVEMPVKNQLQGMLAVFEPLDRAQSKKNFEPSFVKIGWRVQKL
jgi:hypothetical protein